MANTQHVIIIGGHGKIARLTAGKLKAAGYTVDSIIRNPDQRNDVQKAGDTPITEAINHQPPQPNA